MKWMNDSDIHDESAEFEKRKETIENRRSVLSEFSELLNSREDDERVNRVDPDARLMKGGDGKSIIGYNSQAAVEYGEHGIIMTAELSQQATDESLLLDIAKKAKENSGNEIDTILGDAGSPMSLWSRQRLKGERYWARIDCMIQRGLGRLRRTIFQGQNFNMTQRMIAIDALVIVTLNYSV